METSRAFQNKVKVACASLLVVALLSFALPGYSPVYASDGLQGRRFSAANSPAVDQYIYMPVVYKNYTITEGSIYGFVVDAENGNGIPNAQVCYQTKCVTTGSDGSYTLDGLPPGTLTFIVTANTYESLSEAVTIIAGQAVYHQFTLTKKLIYLTYVFIRVILTWSSQPTFPVPGGVIPNDLDAHMWLDILGITEHIFYDHRGDISSTPYVFLQRDATEGSGPETIDINQLEPDGAYYYGVHSPYYKVYPGYIPPLSQQQVTVRLYDDTGLKYTFQNPPSGDGDFWYVFRMSEDGVVTEMNCLINDPGNSIPACP